MLKLIGALTVALALAIALSGCVTQAQVDAAREAYDAAFLTPAAHYRQLGYCAAGTVATLAKPCADRAVVAKLQAADAAVAQAIAYIQAQMIAGQATDLGVLTAAVASAESLVATYVTPLGVK